MSTKIFEAIEQHDLNRLAFELRRGTDPNKAQTVWPQWRPLHVAIDELEDGGSIDALVLLLRGGASANERDGRSDASPLLMALFRNQREAARMLLAVGADPNVVGSEGDSPLRWSVEHDDRGITALLLQCGADQTIDTSGGPSGMTALGRASFQLNLPMVELLLAAGARIDAVDADHRTARERLPPRDTSNQQVWDAIAALLTRSLPTATALTSTGEVDA